MSELRSLLHHVRRVFCRHLFVDFYGRFDGEAFCIDCGKRKVFRDV